MMPRTVILSVLLAACSTAAHAESDSWCQRGTSLGDWQAAPDIVVALVRQEMMDEAVSLLGRRAVIPLSPRAAQKWATQPVAEGYGYYLVRAGLITAGDQMVSDFYWRPSDYRFEIHYSPSTRSINVISVTAGWGMSRPNNIALLVKSRVPIHQAFSYCFGVS